MRATPSAAGRFGALLLLAVAAACSDGNPASVGAPGPAPQTVKLECTVRVRAGTMLCSQPGPGGASASIIVGGQGTYVRLASSGVVYLDSIHTLRADVTLQNLMPQPMGTADGTTPTAMGSLVFFASGPTVTEGTGSVAVANPDTSGTFTAAGQPAFRYPGILQPNQVSAPRTWAFDVPATVTTFAFTVYVQTTLPNESGWVDVSPPHPTLAVGDTMHFRATVRTAAGGIAPGQHVSWSVADSAVARVDSLGFVTALGAGETTVTAIAGNAFGSQPLTVVAGSGGDFIPPALTAFDFTPKAVDTSGGGAAVTVTLGASDAGTGVSPLTLGATFQSPGGAAQATTSGCTRTAGSNAAGTWSCGLTIPQYAEAGTWMVVAVHLEDEAGNAAELTGAEVRGAGFPVALDVTGTQDTAAPLLTAFALAPAAVDVRGAAQAVSFDLAALDSLSGVGSATVAATPPSGGASLTSDPCTLRSGTPASGAYDCSITVPRYVEDGTWTLSVELNDHAGNSRVYGSAELKRLGFQSTLPVTSTSDTIPPSLLQFSFLPDSVTVTESAGTSVHATVRALDAISGVASVSVGFVSPSEFHTATGCDMVSGTGVDGTWTCEVPIDAGVESGTWTALVEITDNAGNLRQYASGDLAAMGFSINLKVGRPVPPPPLELH
jgi:hypothetical protein